MKTRLTIFGPQPVKFMVLPLFLCLIVLFPAAAHAAMEKPERIVSLGICTDQLLLMMAEKGRIASLTTKADNPVVSYMASEVGNIPLNNSSVEEVIPFDPDLVLSSRFASRDTVRMLEKLGYRVELIDLPTNMEELFQLIVQFGEWLGEREKAASIIHQMQQEIAAIQDRNRDKPRLKAIIYSPNGYTIGSNTLENDMLKIAGYINIAEIIGINKFQKISLEKLIQSKPDILLIDNHIYNKNSLASKHIAHPVLERVVPQQRHLFIPTRLRSCPGPMTVEAIAYLAGQK